MIEQRNSLIKSICLLVLLRIYVDLRFLRHFFWKIHMVSDIFENIIIQNTDQRKSLTKSLISLVFLRIYVVSCFSNSLFIEMPMVSVIFSNKLYIFLKKYRIWWFSIMIVRGTYVNHIRCVKKCDLEMIEQRNSLIKSIYLLLLLRIYVGLRFLRHFF